MEAHKALNALNFSEGFVADSAQRAATQSRTNFDGNEGAQQRFAAFDVVDFHRRLQVLQHLLPGMGEPVHAVRDVPAR